MKEIGKQKKIHSEKLKIYTLFVEGHFELRNQNEKFVEKRKTFLWEKKRINQEKGSKIKLLITNLFNHNKTTESVLY